MRLRLLALFPLVFAAVFVVAVLTLDGGALTAFTLGQRLLVRLLAIVGSFWAAAVFARGDHLRRAWQWLAWGTVAVLVRDLLRIVPDLAAWTDASSAGAALVQTLGVLSNVGLLLGVWLLARSWKVAALTVPGGRAGMAVTTTVVAVLALAVAGPAALARLLDVAAGDGSQLVLLVSAVVDVLALCLLSPLLLTAVSLRGGSFSWPFALLAASLLSWLLYDAAAHWQQALSPGGFPTAELFRGLAQNFQFVAGLAQALVVREVRRR
jgi:hypothetical protein